MKKSFLVFALFLFVTGAAFAQAQNPQQKKLFVYVLHITPEYLDVSKWDQNVVRDHMINLKKLYDEGTIIHAGRTEKIDEKSFGIVVFYADSPEQAEEIAKGDPGVKAGMMTAEVFPYMNVFMKGTGK